MPSASALARHSHYLKVRDRASFEFALVSAAVALDRDGDRIQSARIAMGGVATKPWRMHGIEATLAGARPDDAAYRRAAERAADGAVRTQAECVQDRPHEARAGARPGDRGRPRMSTSSIIGVIGQPVSRVDGRVKVTGGARYAAEFDAGPELAHGVVVQSTIARGRVARIDPTAAETAPGVLAVLTHSNAPKLAYRPHKAAVDPAGGERHHVLQDDRVHHQGQPIALVVAETFEQATHGASLLQPTYHEEPAVTALTARRCGPLHPGPATQDDGKPGETRRGDVDGGLATAAVRVEAEYVIPRENHNPIELHATLAAWEDGTLTLWDKTQWVGNVRDEMAAVLGIAAEHIRVISPFVGGAFGSALRAWPHVTLAAMAARHVGRPVKVVLTRRQMYGVTGYRPHTVQRVALGAKPDGTLVAIRHEGVAETSTYEQYTENLLGPTTMLYACPNVATRYRHRAHGREHTSQHAGARRGKRRLRARVRDGRARGRARYGSRRPSAPQRRGTGRA